jgi:hypothetical protein
MENTQLQDQSLEQLLGLDPEVQQIDKLLGTATDEVVVSAETGEVADATPPANVWEKLIKDSKKGKKQATSKPKKEKKVKAETVAAPEALTVTEAVAPDAAAPAAPKFARKHYSNKTDRLRDRIGEKFAEFATLEDGVETTADSTLSIIDGMGSKVKNRAVNLFEHLSQGKEFNEVNRRAVEVLVKDGFITTGDDGNLHANLLARPYDKLTARATGGNAIRMMTALKIVVADGKGKFTPNPKSVLLPKLSASLGIAK